MQARSLSHPPLLLLAPLSQSPIIYVRPNIRAADQTVRWELHVDLWEANEWKGSTLCMYVVNGVDAARMPSGELLSPLSLKLGGPWQDLLDIEVEARGVWLRKTSLGVNLKKKKAT